MYFYDRSVDVLCVRRSLAGACMQPVTGSAGANSCYDILQTSVVFLSVDMHQLTCDQPNHMQKKSKVRIHVPNYRTNHVRQRANRPPVIPVPLEVLDVVFGNFTSHPLESKSKAKSQYCVQQQQRCNNNEDDDDVCSVVVQTLIVIDAII